jgi:hypothetical protein
MDGGALGRLYGLLESLHIHACLVQVGATTVDLCVEDHVADTTDDLATRLLALSFRLVEKEVERGLTLLTVFHPPDPTDPTAAAMLPSNGHRPKTILQQQSQTMVQVGWTF